MKNVRRFGLVMACLTPFWGASALAANWIYVAANEVGTVFYYDADTIQRSGTQVTVWMKWDHSRDKTAKERERKGRSRYDCEQRTETLLNSTVYYPNGQNRSFTWEAYDQSARPVVPDTVGEAILETVCAATAP